MRSIQNKLASKSEPIMMIGKIKVFDMKKNGISFMFDTNGRHGEGQWLIGKIQKNRFSGELKRYRRHAKARAAFIKGH